MSIADEASIVYFSFKNTYIILINVVTCIILMHSLCRSIGIFLLLIKSSPDFHGVYSFTFTNVMKTFTLQIKYTWLRPMRCLEKKNITIKVDQRSHLKKKNDPRGLSWKIIHKTLCSFLWFKVKGNKTTYFYHRGRLER